MLAICAVYAIAYTFKLTETLNIFEIFVVGSYVYTMMLMSECH